MELQNSKIKNVSNDLVYPFIDEIVDILFTKNVNSLVENSIEYNSDKSIFMMFITMYFAIHLKLDIPNDENKKTHIKQIMTEMINDPEKRLKCIQLFQSKFQDLYNSNSMIQN